MANRSGGGDGTRAVSVSGTVTNVGHVAGSDVAQLYLGDPASSGEPPRQLVAFGRVSLRPGQSAQVHFTIQPSQTWYWDEGADGWTQQAGTYSVYLGDSSALAGLPRRGSFAITDATGARQVSVRAPAQMTAGHPYSVTVGLSAGGTGLLHGAQLLLQAPDGWVVHPAGPEAAGALDPGSAASRTFSVTVPAGSPVTTGVLHGVASLGPCGGDLSSVSCLGVQREAGVTVTVSPS